LQSKSSKNKKNLNTQEQQQQQLQRAHEVDLKETKKRRPMVRPNFRAKPHGHLVAPQVLLANNASTTTASSSTISESSYSLTSRTVPQDQILTAYLEPIDKSTWDVKPLPVRTVKANDLSERRFPKLNSCYRLPEQWPVDDYPDADPFLPWIHDVFPTEDGKYIQFVAQNLQRCHTGTTDEEQAILEHTAPQVALFQHVPLKKLNDDNKTPHYRLSSHEDADPESVSTRFICRFKPSGDITFSEFNNDYEWVTRRKGQKVMFQCDGRNNKQIHTSQLLFKCPVPDHLVDIIRSGLSVVDDWATIFVDLIPVRTPPRYGPADEFLSPKYAESMGGKARQTFDPHVEWGEDHVLPELEDSGRWANIPVCKPSLMTYEPQALEGPNTNDKVKHHLISCLWASTGYATRGNRYAVNDGQRRMLEWIAFNKLLGFDHFYIFDNSGAFTNQSSLQPFVHAFPGDVTVINWPSRVCNNNPNNVDSVGERSSQYAAESSCRLRFGPHTNWIG
jgi:Glycosyltransferase family 92